MIVEVVYINRLYYDEVLCMNLISFDDAMSRLGVTEEGLDALIDDGKLAVHRYLGDVMLSADEVEACLPAAAKAEIEPETTPVKVVSSMALDSRVERIQAMLAEGVREVGARMAAELLGVNVSWMSRLGREGRVNCEKRGNCNWYLLEDVETYARLQNVWASKSGAWSPYGKMDAKDWHADMRLVAPQKKAYDERPSVAEEPDADDYRLDARQAASILGVSVSQARWVISQNGIANEKEKRRIGFSHPRWRMLLTVSARALFALADRREQRRSRTDIAPHVWNERMVRPIICTKIEPPPGDRLIGRQEAAFLLGIAQKRVSRLVATGRLFGWQKQPGRSGSALWLSERQVVRYGNDPDRLARRAAYFREARGPSPLGKETESEVWMEDRGLASALKYARSTSEDREHGEFFNSRQTAKLLGIGRRTLNNLMHRGRIAGYQKARSSQDGAGNKWWFYRKDDVYNLLGNGEYTRKRDRHRAAKLRSLGRWVPDSEGD